jgi:hypothetical protein
MAQITLQVQYVNKTRLRAARTQNFNCDQMANITRETVGGTSYTRFEASKPGGTTGVPTIFHVIQSPAQIHNLCCCGDGTSTL